MEDTQVLSSFEYYLIFKSSTMWLLFVLALCTILLVVSFVSGIPIPSSTVKLYRREFKRFACATDNRRGNDGNACLSRSHKTLTNIRGGEATASTENNPFQVFLKTIQDGRRHLAAAAIARSVSIFVMYPVDAIKTRLQIKQANPFRLQGLLKGVNGSLLGQVPYGVLTFGSYEMYKKALLDRFPTTKPIWLYALSAILGDLTGSFWLCPSEVVKQQVQAGMHPSTGAAVANIFRNKGFAGFYQGYIGGISRDVPFRVAQLTTFEVTKSIFLKVKRKRAELLSKSANTDTIELTPIEAAICGAVSGSFSAAITSPLDRFKTLLMTSSQEYGGNVIACAAKIWKEEGISGITTGMGPRVIYIAPSVVIFFVTYEMSQQRLKRYFEKTD